MVKMEQIQSFLIFVYKLNIRVYSPPPPQIFILLININWASGRNLLLGFYSLCCNWRMRCHWILWPVFISALPGQLMVWLSRGLAGRGLEIGKSMFYFCFWHYLLLHLSFSKIHWHYTRNKILYFVCSNFTVKHKYTNMNKPFKA